MSIPERVGVLGGGRMGAGIAHAFLLAGAEVVVVERDAELAAAAGDRIRKSIAESVRRGTTDRSAKQLDAQLVTDVDVVAFAGCDLVIEAVPEDLALKLDALRRVEAAIEPGSPLASNTSSISIDTLAGRARPPGRLPRTPLLQPGARVAARRDRARRRDRPRAGRARARLGRRPRQDADHRARRPRLRLVAPRGRCSASEAIRMLEDGVASADDIDAAMTLGYQHPIGPLRLTDLVGLDVRLGIAEYLHAELGDRFEPPALLRRLVAEGKLGRKTGEGFFVWEDES